MQAMKRLPGSRLPRRSEYQALLSSLKARDGVMSVLGNHDYTYYMDVDDEQRCV